MFKSKTFFWTVEILLIVLIIYASTKISFVFQPIGVFVSTLFFPILISGFLFLLFNPVVNFMEKRKVNRTVAILVLYIVFIGFAIFVTASIGPVLSRQVTDLVGSIPTYVKEMRGLIEDLSNSRLFKWVMTQDYVSIQEIENYIVEFTTKIPDAFTASLSKVFSVVTNITLIIVTVPFILFYMFKDGQRFPHTAVRLLPSSYRDEGLNIIDETGETLSAYIQGQVLVALMVGTLTFIGYLIIGLPFALVLAVVIAITNIIPYVGVFIGVAPALIIALLESPTKALLVIVVVLVVQQVEGNLLSPMIIGKRLNTHPLTIIILLLVAGNLAGVLGMILAVPTYAVAKTVIVNVVRLIKLRNQTIDS